MGLSMDKWLDSDGCSCSRGGYCLVHPAQIADVSGPDAGKFLRETLRKEKETAKRTPLCDHAWRNAGITVQRQPILICTKCHSQKVG